MNIEQVPFHTTDWSSVPSTEHSGLTGLAHWKTIEIGNIRVRMVQYSENYLADHWCHRGHVLLVLEGELTTELEDGRVFVLKKGMTYQVANNGEPHRSSTTLGATLFIVD